MLSEAAVLSYLAYYHSAWVQAAAGAAFCDKARLAHGAAGLGLVL